MNKDKLVPDPENNFQIGLQTEADVRIFNSSHVGREIIKEKIKKWDELEKLIEEGMRQARNEAIQQAQISAYVHEKAEKKDHHQEPEEPFYLKQEQQRKAEEASRLLPESPQSNPYVSLVKNLDNQIQAIETKQANTEQQYLEYYQSLENADDFEITSEGNKCKLRDKKLADLGVDDKASSITSLREKLYGADGNGGLQAQYKATAEQAMQALDAACDPDDPEQYEKLKKAKDCVSKAKAQGMEIVQLEEMLAVVEGEKIMYKKDGTLAETFAEADFLVKKDQQLIKEGDDFYLLDKGTQLTDDNRASAKQDFEYAKSGMCSLHELIDTNKSIDMAEIQRELEQAQAARQQAVNSQNATSQPDLGMSAPSNTASSPMDAVTENQEQFDNLSSPEKPSSGIAPDPEMDNDNENRASTSV